MNYIIKIIGRLKAPIGDVVGCGDIVGLRVAVLFSLGRRSQITTSRVLIVVPSFARSFENDDDDEEAKSIPQFIITCPSKQQQQQQTLSSLFEKTVHEICSHLRTSLPGAESLECASTRLPPPPPLPIKGPHLEPRKAPATNSRPTADFNLN